MSVLRALTTDETRPAESRARENASADPRLRMAGPLVSFVAPGSFEADQYRALRHLVERMRRDDGFQVFAVTSPGASEGKTITALNLAGSLAESPGARVLVIDAGLHHPSVAHDLGLGRPRSPGLAEALLDEDYTLAHVVRRIDALNISVLSNGAAAAGLYELLTSRRLDGLLAEARRLYDYVLIDTPPVVAVADSRLLARVIDGYIVVVAAHRTTRRLLEDALDLLDPAKVAAVVFNGDDRPLSTWWQRLFRAERHR